jgi:Glycosyltransferase family 87
VTLANPKGSHGIGAAIGSCSAACSAIAKRGLLRWPDRMLGPRPGLKEVTLVCWCLFVSCLVVPVSVALWFHWRAGSLGDFVYFYGIGHLANEHSPVKLYDYALQLKIFNQTEPLQDGAWGPSPYPPFVALFFSPFARIPFRWAYLFWLGVSLILYLVGVMATIKGTFPKERLKGSLALCFALAYPPFLMNTLINGQLASVAVCCTGLAIALERKSKPIVSGLALSVLSYKPTLLILLLPMLLLTRRLKTLVGFVIGTLILVLVSTASMGVQVWPVYAHFLRLFGQVSRTEGRSALLRWQFVDLNSLSYAVPGGRSELGLAILIGVAIIALLWLATLLWKSSAGSKQVQSLTWATVLTWTLVLNVYVPIYDSILLTVALLLALGALRELGLNHADGWFASLAVLIIAVSWMTGPIAKSHGIQLLTILLFALGLWQAVQLHRAMQTPAIVPAREG